MAVIAQTPDIMGERQSGQDVRTQNALLMGSASKRSKAAQGDSDSEEEADMVYDMVNEEELFGDEEEEEEDDDDKVGEDSEGIEEDEVGGMATVSRDAEMEELEKDYMLLRQEEIDILKNLKHHKDGELLKGQAVKNQKVLWDKSLEFRFLLQKAFSSSNRLPKEPIRSLFCESDDGVGVAYSDLMTSAKETLTSLLELQEALLGNNNSITQAIEGHSSGSSCDPQSKMSISEDEDWSRVTQMQTSMAPFISKAIDKWHRKTQVTTGATAIRGKLQAFNQSISEQVAIYMRDPSRMMKQMQLRRPTVDIFGEVSKKDGSVEEAQGDGDPELLDDSEFYQQLLKEFFQALDPNSSEATFYALKKVQTKKRKLVDRRASKSRKIRYNVHEKIVNFMAPQPMDLPPMATQLFNNLFGLKTQKVASVRGVQEL